MNYISADYCEFENKLNETVTLFVKNVTDPIQEFWERKALQQTGGVSTSQQSKC